jgi:topoisomerase-4 subunit B
MRSFINDFIKTELDNYLHRHPETADALMKRIIQSERERRDMAGIKKLANERAKKANLHNKKLRDCRIHFNENGNGKGDKNHCLITLTVSVFIKSYAIAGSILMKTETVRVMRQ